MNPNCHECDVKINKEKSGWYLMYKLTNNNTKSRKKYFCDFICAMDYLHGRPQLPNFKMYRFEDSEGNTETLEKFWEGNVKASLTEEDKKALHKCTGCGRMGEWMTICPECFLKAMLEA